MGKVTLPSFIHLRVHSAYSLAEGAVKIVEEKPKEGAKSPRKDLIAGETIVARNGYLAIPDKPGWGYEMNEEAFKRMPPRPWHRAFAFDPDGAPGFI